MTINLISKVEYNELLEIQKNYPALTYQNKGYDYPDKSKWTLEETEAFKKASNILKKCILGFSEFNHFRLSWKGDVEIRFQYDWSADQEGITFIGVGYLSVEELFKGFKKQATTNDEKANS
jgi:hypothetical protein